MNNIEIFTRLNDIPTIIKCGIHSGFPACCIHFYITEKIWMTAKKNKNYTVKIEKSNINWGYIPCPSCLLFSNVVKVLPCPEDAFCVSINEYPDNIPFERTKETERALAYRLRDEMSFVQSSFAIIRKGESSINGAVSSAINNKLGSMSKLILDAS